jgi:hypothetical protein
VHVLDQDVLRGMGSCLVVGCRDRGSWAALRAPSWVTARVVGLTRSEHARDLRRVSRLDHAKNLGDKSQSLHRRVARDRLGEYG